MVDHRIISNHSCNDANAKEWPAVGIPTRMVTKNGLCALQMIFILASLRMFSGCFASLHIVYNNFFKSAFFLSGRFA